MTTSGDESITITATLPPSTSGAATAPSLFHSIADAGTAPATSARNIYLRAGQAMLPRWLRIVRSAPWLTELTEARHAATHEPLTLFRLQAATLSMAMLCELDIQRSDGDYLRACVRAALIRWQSSISGEGSPIQRRFRRSPWHGGTLHHLIQLVTETTGLQSNQLLVDIDAHVRWISRQRPATPWLEAATICALADSALLIRDTIPLRVARKRLEALLDSQDEEGWFSEGGGPDIGRLSLTVDALALLYRNHAWPELEKPLASAIAFLTHFVHPDGSVGGCYSSCQSAFVSPVGFELLASRFREAAAMADRARRYAERMASDEVSALDDNLCAVLGAGFMTAAANAGSVRDVVCRWPHQEKGRTRFPNAGLSVFSNQSYYAVVAERKGGAARITWRHNDRPLDDAGLAVVGTHGLRHSAKLHARTQSHISSQGHAPAGTCVVCTGILRRENAVADVWWQRLQRIPRRVVRLLRRTTATDDSPAQPMDVFRGRQATGESWGGGQRNGERREQRGRRVLRQLTHDYFRRSIRFGERRIEIRDEIVCRLPCRAVILQSPIPPHGEPFGDRTTPEMQARPPLIIDGGRRIQVTRAYEDGELVDPSSAPKELPGRIA